MVSLRDKTRMVSPEEALVGRSTPLPVPERHAVLARPLRPPFPEHLEQAVFAMGCFWAPEQVFWQLDGVWTTAVGYAGGYTPNPTYGEVCSGRTGHAEAVLVVFDPEVVSYQDLLEVFWAHHDPTQWMRQGMDMGTQYRSAIFPTTEAQRAAAEASRAQKQQALDDAGGGRITTEIAEGQSFYYAEDYHQQYAAKR